MALIQMNSVEEAVLGLIVSTLFSGRMCRSNEFQPDIFTITTAVIISN